MHIFNKYLFYKNILITYERDENNLLYKTMNSFLILFLFNIKNFRTDEGQER